MELTLVTLLINRIALLWSLFYFYVFLLTFFCVVLALAKPKFYTWLS